MRQYYLIFLISFSLFPLSCSHFIKTKSAGVFEGPSVSHEEEDSSTVYSHLEEDYNSSYEDIPLVSHPNVDRWILYFTGNGKAQMQAYLERSSRYLPLMKSVLREKGLPSDLVYVALIESGFSPKALSRANAVGYWQFIYGTGKRYGLRIDGYVDERRDPVLSTRAAANYFKDLYSLFGSWPLALAAYNSGEYRVNRAVLRHYNRDFWFLSAKKALPRETRNYIPKLIAAIHISKDPAAYGFDQLNYQEPISYELIKIQQPISLLKLAQQTSSSEDEIKALNPMYKGEYVPVYSNETVIRVPVGSLTSAQAGLEKSRMKAPKLSPLHHYWYRIRRGDSLYKIARRHKTTVRKIQRANRMGARTLLRVGRKIKIPSRRLILRAEKKTDRAQRLTASAATEKEFYTVRAGQGLSAVAKGAGISLSRLKELNNMQGNPLIHPGQKLRIRPSAEASAQKYHVVQKGETLIGIAKKYRIPLPKLMKANAMSFKSVLLTGARLSLPR